MFSFALAIVVVAVERGGGGVLSGAAVGEIGIDFGVELAKIHLGKIEALQLGDCEAIALWILGGAKSAAELRAALNVDDLGQA